MSVFIDISFQSCFFKSQTQPDVKNMFWKKLSEVQIQANVYQIIAIDDFKQVFC